MRSLISLGLVLGATLFVAPPCAAANTAEAPAPDGYAARQQEMLEAWARDPGGVWGQMAALTRGGTLDERPIRRTLANIDERHDCADFSMVAILRLLYQFGASGALSEGLLAEIKRSVLGFKYWPDEPGIDSMCSWTENHQIAFAVCGYLAGQMFPNETFTNSGHTGREKMAQHRPRIARWLDMRFRTGFSEWLSNDYYNPNLTTMVFLADYSADQDLARRALMITDLLLADMALNSFQGSFCSTHGRSYQEDKRWANREKTTEVSKLMFGRGSMRGASMGAVSLALSTHYRMPRVIYEIANDATRPEMTNRQRMGIRVAEAERWGLRFDSLEDGMVFLGLGAYAHPQTIDLTMAMFDAYRWWENGFFRPFQKQREMIEEARATHSLPFVAQLYEKDIARNVREEVNILTYRTPDYLLSTAQDYRKGFGGDQHHIWQATLGPDAVCFTTHPVPGEAHMDTPGYWAGSGSLPRVGQCENVAIAIYDVVTEAGLYVRKAFPYTHAWFPKDEFDEVIEQEEWFFARLGDGYLALRSQQPCHWQRDEGENKNREIIAPGTQNIWICELGRKAVDGTFPQFVERIVKTPLTFDTRKVAYTSPSQGRLEFAWEGPLRRNGETVPLTDYPRYDNPYVQAAFPADRIEVHSGAHRLVLDWASLEREADAFLGGVPGEG